MKRVEFTPFIHPATNKHFHQKVISVIKNLQQLNILYFKLFYWTWQLETNNVNANLLLLALQFNYITISVCFINSHQCDCLRSTCIWITYLITHLQQDMSIFTIHFQVVTPWLAENFNFSETISQPFCEKWLYRTAGGLQDMKMTWKSPSPSNGSIINCCLCPGHI